jgi:diguanylate cyclase (GGDEF)-like protein
VSQNTGSGGGPSHPEDEAAPGDPVVTQESRSRALPLRPVHQRPLANLRHATVRAAAVRAEASVARQGATAVRQSAPDPADARFRAENRVAALLAPGAIRAAFQPVVRLIDGAVVGYEALARTDLLDGSPDQWLEAASVVGLRVEVELACLEAATVAGRPPDGALLFVNASPATVLDPRMRDMVHRLPRCVIEITEHDAVHDYERLRAVLAELRGLGCLVAVDDVGAGYASMAHVLALAPSFVKIDRSLVDGMHADPGRRALVQALQAFTSAIGGATIAEGVETVADLRELRALGVDLVQGFGVAKPGEPWPTLAPVPRRVLRPHGAGPALGEDGELTLALAAASTRAAACEAVAARLGAVGGIFPMIYLDGGGVLRCQSRRGQWLVPDGLQPGVGIIGAAFVEERELLVDDVTMDSRYRVAVAGVCAELAIPLRVDDRVVGVLNVDAVVPLGARVTALVRRAAESLESRLAELPETEAQIAGLRGLPLHTRAVATAPDPERLARALLVGVCELTGFDTGCLWRLSDGGALAAHGPGGTTLAGLGPEQVRELAVLADGTASLCTGGTDLGVTFAGTEALRDLGVRGAVIVPVRDGRRVTDLLVAVSRASATVGAEAVLAAEEMAVLAGARLGPLRELRTGRVWQTGEPLVGRVAGLAALVPHQPDAAPVERGVPEHGTDLEVVPEFGLLDAISDLAHEEYLAGSAEQAVGSSRRLRLMAEAVGDHTTARYLRYTEAVSLLALARFDEALEAAAALVDQVGGTGVWRCKALAVVAEASSRVGNTADAITALADASWTLRQVRTGTYGHASASLAVAIALRSAHLFERSESVMRGIGPLNSPLVELLVSGEEAALSAQWAGMLTLVGRTEEARARAPRIISAALRTQRLARGVGRDDAVARGEVFEATGWYLLGEIEVAGRLATAARPRFEPRIEQVESDLVHLLTGVAAMAAGRYEEAEAALEEAVRTASAARRTVWETAARSQLAELDVVRNGSTRAVALWRDVAATSLAMVWEEREARFAALRGASSIRVLSDRVERHGRASQEDPLTGLGNRRFLDQVLDGEPGRSVVFIDVDDFKEVNDGWSHAVGDRVLREVARVLRTCARSGDLLARYGGDEFVAVPAGGVDGARELAQRVHQAIADHDWGLLVPGLRLTVSVGVGHAGAYASASESALFADHALHEAKRGGRNRVVEATAPTTRSGGDGVLPAPTPAR